MSPLINEGTDLALRFASASGQTVVNADSPLTRLNYFDGKFLRADDLRREQSYMRQLVQFSNQGLGAGIVYGMDTVLDNKGRLSIGAGLAMDSTGRTLLIGQTATLDVAALIDASRRIASSRLMKTGLAATGAEFGDCIESSAPPADGLTPAGSLYVICVGHAESLCGTEDVYGRLCEEACVTATDRPLVVEGVVVRALPLTLRTPLASSRVPLDRRHLRSLVASAYFEDERHIVESLISRAGLALDTWCVGAELSAVGCVPLAVISRAGAATVFLDAWTVRRERMNAPAKRYWAWRMAMRPWDVFLAHVLQFQCQLHEVLGDDPSDPGNVDPCAPQQSVLSETAKYLSEVDQTYTQHIEALAKLDLASNAFQPQDARFQLQGGVASLARLRERIDGALKVMIAGPRSRVLINGGIVELPSAGYLPVVPGTVTVNDQVRRLLGEGLDLRFCIVRPDFVPHALEEAQHMERISLLEGLDDPQAKPEVDILVPNGDLLLTTASSLTGFDTQLRLLPTMSASLAGANSATITSSSAPPKPLMVHGAARGESNGTGGSFHFAGAQEAVAAKQVIGLVSSMNDFVAAKAKTRDTMLRTAVRNTTAGSFGFARSATPVDDILSRFSARAVAAAGAPIDTAGAPMTSPSGELTNAAAATPPAPLVGIWTTMRTERDPYTLGVAETTPMSVEFTLTSERTTATGADTHVLMRIRAFATFSATQAPVDGPSGRVMTGNLSGTYTVQAFLETTTGADNTKPFDVDVKLLRTGNAASGTVRVQFGTGAASYQFQTDASWGGQPLEATLKLSLLLGQRLQVAGLPSLLEVLSANAITDPEALAEGGGLRLLSTNALGLIGDELTRATQNGIAFVDVAERLLFPPPPPPTDDLTVRATLDWVLFHRRRTKRCAPSVSQPASTAARRYQLYTFRAKNQQEVDLVRRTLQTSGTFTRGLRRVDALEFASGAGTLVTPSDALLSDWTAAQPGNTLVYGFIATSVAADAPLANARLARAARGVAAISPFDPVQGVLEVLPSVPATMTVPGTDGVLLLVTLDAVHTTCHDVYRVVLDAEAQRYLKQSLLDRLLTLPGTTNLGEAQFDDGSTIVDAADAAALKQLWKGAGVVAPAEVYVFPKPNDTSGGDDVTLTARGRAIADALGGTANTTVQTGQAQGAWPVGATCPVVTVVGVPAQRLLRVVMIETGGQVGMPVMARVPIVNDVVGFDGTSVQQDARFKAMIKELEAFFAPGKILRSLIGLELATNSALDTAANDRLESMFKTLASTTPPITDGSHPRQPRRVRAATTSEAAFFGENGVSVDDLLVMTITQSINA